VKALSIKEPWSSLILNGHKTIETRTWKTTYRGKLLLCASKKPESAISGMAFAIADLAGIQLMKKEDEGKGKACCEIYDRAYSWFLENVTPIKPFPVKGQLGLFDADYVT
jgi:hypothetical protein